MLHELIAAGIGLLGGYAIGTVLGYKAAVIDYVENDADRIEQLAAELYPSHTAEGQPSEIPDEVGAVMAEVREDEDEEQDDGTGRGFQ